MKNLVINEANCTGKDLGGRVVTWLYTPETMETQYCSVCTVVYESGARAVPAHSHVAGEETVYVTEGTGKVLIGEDIYDIQPGSIMFFPQGIPHMMYNTGNVPLKGICFYAPSAEAIGYTFHEDVDFPEFQKVSANV